MNTNNKDLNKESNAASAPADKTNIKDSADNIKGTLYRWSDASSEWYEIASEYTGYHDRLTEVITPHLGKEYECCELACGTGTLARHLAPHVKSYTANDIDFHATDHLAEMISDGSCPNMEIIEGDWHEVFKDRVFNAVVFSFFGALMKDWDNLKKLASDKIVVISPRSREGKIKAVARANEKAADPTFENTPTDAAPKVKEAFDDMMKSDSDKSAPAASDADSKKAPEDAPRFIRGKARSFETGPNIAEFLDEKGISYVREDLDLEFGQPFANLSQARDYTRYYYKLDERDIDYFLEKKLERTEDGWYFPKKKEISVIIIDMKTAK